MKPTIGKRAAINNNKPEKQPPPENKEDFVMITHDERTKYFPDAIVFLSVAVISQEELDKINTEEER